MLLCLSTNPCNYILLLAQTIRKSPEQFQIQFSSKLCWCKNFQFQIKMQNHDKPTTHINCEGDLSKLGLFCIIESSLTTGGQPLSGIFSPYVNHLTKLYLFQYFQSTLFLPVCNLIPTFYQNGLKWTI